MHSASHVYVHTHEDTMKRGLESLRAHAQEAGIGKLFPSLSLSFSEREREREREREESQERKLLLGHAGGAS